MNFKIGDRVILIVGMVGSELYCGDMGTIYEIIDIETRTPQLRVDFDIQGKKLGIFHTSFRKLTKLHKALK